MASSLSRPPFRGSGVIRMSCSAPSLDDLPPLRGAVSAMRISNLFRSIRFRVGLFALASLALAACERPTPSSAANPPVTPVAATPAPVPAYVGATYAPVPGKPQSTAAQLTALGRKIFFD